MNNNKKLKMKEVGNEYMEQYNDLLRYVFQVTDQELDSIDWEEKEIKSRSDYFLTDREYEVLDNEERLRKFNEYYIKKFQEQVNKGDTEQ